MKAPHLTRPGGLAVAIALRYTTDAANLAFALRLPEQTHQLAGTQVVTDLILPIADLAPAESITVPKLRHARL